MVEKMKVVLPNGSKISKDINKVSNKLGELIDNGLTERVYKNIKKPNIKI